LQPNLSLDLSADRITFTFPGDVDNALVQAFTSDVTTDTTMGLNSVPEPTTLLLFGTTAAGLGLARWRQWRRKQQP
jgi:hypothetical protein